MNSSEVYDIYIFFINLIYKQRFGVTQLISLDSITSVVHKCVLAHIMSPLIIYHDTQSELKLYFHGALTIIIGHFAVISSSQYL